MKKVLVCLLTIIVLSELTLGQEKELSQLEMFFFRNVTPVLEYQAVREMEVRNPGGKVVAQITVLTKLSPGAFFTYQILSDKHEGLAGSIAKDNLIKLLERESEEAGTSAFAKNGFVGENYLFTQSEDLGHIFQISLKARRKGGLLINGMIFLDKAGKLLRSEGILTKNPSFMTNDVLVVITYGEIAGARLPVSYDSRFNVRFNGRWTMSTRYTYTSVNGVPVIDNQ